MRQKNELRPYQDRIATTLYENDEAMVVLRPGGGKTITALTAIEELLRDKVIRHALVIAPKRVATVVWPDELDSWRHVTHLKYAVLDQAPHHREVLLMHREVVNRDMTIVGIDLVPWLIKQLEGLSGDSPLFDLLCIDEASRLRNPRGKRAKDLAKHAHRWKMIWGLSGTLRPSSAQDLFMPSRVVTRGKLWGKSFDGWRKRHFYAVDFQGYDWQPLPGAEDKLNAEIAPLVATVAEGELIQPEPTIVIDRVQLPTDVMHQYTAMNRMLVAKVEDKTIVAASTGVATGKMAQIANGFLYNENKTVNRMHDAKRAWLDDIIEGATGPTILVYDFNEDLAMIEDALPGIPYLGAGITSGQAESTIKAWNAGKLPFLGLHPASGGHGLNLQHGGSDMAWLAPTWSPEYWEQTIARLNRSGQKRQVIVRVCVADNTVDDLKLDRVHHKMTAQEAFEAYLRRCQTRNKTG
jgi:hypothetical protein